MKSFITLFKLTHFYKLEFKFWNLLYTNSGLISLYIYSLSAPESELPKTSVSFSNQHDTPVASVPTNHKPISDHVILNHPMESQY